MTMSGRSVAMLSVSQGSLVRSKRQSVSQGSQGRCSTPSGWLQRTETGVGVVWGSAAVVPSVRSLLVRKKSDPMLCLLFTMNPHVRYATIKMVNASIDVPKKNWLRPKFHASKVTWFLASGSKNYEISVLTIRCSYDQQVHPAVCTALRSPVPHK